MMSAGSRKAASRGQFAQQLCPICSGADQIPLLAIPAMPVVGCNLASSQSAALETKRGDLDIVFCPGCGHVYNRAFRSEAIAYSADYENALSFSPRHSAYLDHTVEQLIQRQAIRGKKIVEIGCGDGEFLRRLCERGGNRGIGYDPSQPNQPPRTLTSGTIEIVGALFDEAAPGAIDVICSKHVLEHLLNPIGILRNARAKLIPGGVGYFEVPNGRLMLDEIGVWDLTYEHFSYFSPASLRRALIEAGFCVQRLKTSFGNQYLTAEVTAETPAASTEAEDGQACNAAEFAQRAANVIGTWKRRLTEYREKSRKVVLWGAGTKAVAFLNILDVRRDRDIDYVIDINPRKTGRFLPGTAQQIVQPDFLRSYRPDVVIVMNPEYLAEIQGQLSGLVGGNLEIVTAALCSDDTAKPRLG